MLLGMLLLGLLLPGLVLLLLLGCCCWEFGAVAPFDKVTAMNDCVMHVSFFA